MCIAWSLCWGAVRAATATETFCGVGMPLGIASLSTETASAMTSSPTCWGRGGRRPSASAPWRARVTRAGSWLYVEAIMPIVRRISKPPVCTRQDQLTSHKTSMISRREEQQVLGPVHVHPSRDSPNRADDVEATCKLAIDWHTRSQINRLD